MLSERRPPPGTLPGEWEPPALSLDPPAPELVIHNLHPSVWLIKGALTGADCALLCAAMSASGQACPVSVSGHQAGNTALGSVRATAWSPALGQSLWQKIRAAVPTHREMTDDTPTDWYALGDREAHRRWRAVGVGPVLRFMRYEAGGQHCAHYDMGYDYPADPRRTLMSLVAYLTTVLPDTGGCTRIIRDSQESLPIWARCHDDWTRPAHPEEVLLAVRPIRGDVLLFDHRLCHDVEPYTGATPRIILRGDVVFAAAAPTAPCP